MEKISAACALGWSIDLEKGLRSRKPGKFFIQLVKPMWRDASMWSIDAAQLLDYLTFLGSHMEAIRQIGDRLNQWSREPQLTLAVCKMFGLVPGEDRVFLDAILFRLADAFVSGDKTVCISVTKIFYSTFRTGKRKESRTHGIFSNMSSANTLELLRRVGSVLRADCVKSRAMAFILFGCWADIAKDVVEIRDAILSSLTSSHVIEVKASLFAAGCFSECSNDFGYVFLEKLLTIITSENTPPSLKTAGARSLASTGCSLLLAIKSYKAGAERVQEISEDDVLAAMLISLTKISWRVVALIPEQVRLLSMFLSPTTQNTSSNMQATVLRCILFIGERSVGFLTTGGFLFQSLFRMLDEPNTPSALRCDVFKIFLKVISYGLPNLLSDEFMKLLRYVDDATQSPFLCERPIAFEILVCISTKLKGFTDASEIDLAGFPSRVTATIFDQITVLVCRLSGGTPNSEVGEELGRMLRMLLILFGDHSELGYLILDKLHLVIENFVNSHSLSSADLQPSQLHKVVAAGAEEIVHPVRVMMLRIFKFLVAFLEILHETGDTTEELHCQLKHLLSLVCGCNVFDCSIHTLYSIIWYSHVMRSCLSAGGENSDVSVGGLSISNKMLELEAVINMCAKNMLEGGDNWCAYRAGRYAACGGIWDVANFIFHHLVTRVQSDFCCKWLEFVDQLSYSEKNLHTLLRQKPFSIASDHFLKSCGLDRNQKTSAYVEQLVTVCNYYSSLDNVLEAMPVPKHTFYFQKWFLALRRKVILMLVDVLQFLHNFLFCKVGVLGDRCPGKGNGDPLASKLKDMLSSLNDMSSKLASLAEEIDLVISSFIDMDSSSTKIMSDLALSCSLLAFCTKFSNLIVYGSPTKTSGDIYYAIVKKLVGLLWPIDFEVCLNLLSLLKDNGLHEGSLQMLPKSHSSKSRRISDDFLTVCRYTVKRMIDLQNQSLGVQNQDASLQVYEDIMHSILNIVEARMHSFVQIPKYLFRVRSTMGSLLFWSIASGKQKELLVSPGSHLALNLCIQLKDMPADICLQFPKIYCILYCRTSSSVTSPMGQHTAETRRSYQASETDTMIHLNNRLQCYMIKQTTEFMHQEDLCIAGEVAEAYACFETNGRAQGFSTCLLDVSTFPVGSYSIYWHSGAFDSHGAYWSFLPLNHGPQFTVR